jgi:hypothetical protein
MSVIRNLRGVHATIDELDRDLFVFPTFDIMQHQNRTRTGRQTRYRSFEIHAEGGADAGGIATTQTDQHRIVGFQILVVAARAQVHQCCVDREPMQPCAERTLEAKPGQCLPRAHERFLGQFFRSRIVAANHSPDDRMHAPHMLAIERLESAHIACDSQSHQHVVRFVRWTGRSAGKGFGLHGNI